MKHSRFLLIAAGLPLCILAGVEGASVQAAPARHHTAPKAAAVKTPTGVVEPEAVAALHRMSAYLASLNTAAIVSTGSLDVVTDDGQRLQLDGVMTYKVRRPNGFVIDYNSDIKKRRFVYDGKTFTVYAPATGQYATAPAPATNREVLDTIYDKYGIALPLEDLLRWNEKTNRDADLKSAFQAGTATLDGVETDHYAFREKDVDWEVWIQQGDQPLPRKLVIVDRTSAARPTFITHLEWKVNPTFADSDFTFVPDKNAQLIGLATYKPGGN